ncbi:hypothetical protein IAU59_001713 [Kwoniella sp. CBS 9459]
MALVDYDSSSSDASSGSDTDDERPRREVHLVTSAAVASARALPNKVDTEQPAAKRPRRQLPSLPPSFESAPKDDPALHQGRSRSRPYVDGDYNAHVYLSLSLPAPLRAILDEYLAALQSLLKDHTIHSSLESLHISLTHPLPLRRHQIVPFRDSLTARLRAQGSFRLSLVGDTKVYHNGSQIRSMGHAAGHGGGIGGGGGDHSGRSGSRAFFALRTGAGSVELKAIIDDIIHPILEKLHLPTYHENPEFHTSFAWCLLKPRLPAPRNSMGVPTSDADALDEYEAQAGPNAPRELEGSGFKAKATESPTLPLTNGALADLNARYRHKILARQPKGGWEVDSVRFKAGKEVSILALR